jgi:hypothetical protein
MKKVIYLPIFILVLPLIIRSQQVNTLETDPQSGKEILVGYCDRSGLMLGTFGELYNQYYPIYKPDRTVIRQLKGTREGLDIVIVLGTWCSDSHEQVPKFLKVLDKMRFDEERLKMICVDREKLGGEVDVLPYNVVFVPTFIFLKNGKEIGRIVETPIRTLEVDMLGIVGE